MLNEDKIKLMAELSIMEKKYNKEIFSINGFFKGDYILKNLLQSFLGFSFCYVLFLGLELLYSLEKIINTINVSDVLVIFYGYLLRYVIGLIIFEIITWYISKIRYESALKKKGLYMAKLKRLQKRYDFQNKSKELGGIK
ncbi:MAG: hypothetical protein Q4A19_03035 [Johnsonella sp.]|nr:hypothetical protein [Johnsonella sp.]